MMLGPRLKPSLTCDVCGQPLDDERREADADEVALFGAARFAQCIGCARIVEKPWTLAYERRWMDRLRRVREEWSKRLFVHWSNGVRAAEGGNTFSACALPVGPDRDAWGEGWAFIWQGGERSKSSAAFKRWFEGIVR